MKNIDQAAQDVALMALIDIKLEQLSLKLKILNLLDPTTGKVIRQMEKLRAEKKNIFNGYSEYLNHIMED